MNNEIENNNEDKIIDINTTNNHKSKKTINFNLTNLVNYGAIALSVIAISLFIKIEYFKPINQVFYVDNANIRAMYQNIIQKDILESKIKEETQIATVILNFDKDLENVLNTLTRDYGINIYASRAFYSADENIDLTPKIIEMMEAKGYKFQ